MSGKRLEDDKLFETMNIMEFIFWYTVGITIGLAVLVLGNIIKDKIEDIQVRNMMIRQFGGRR